MLDPTSWALIHGIDECIYACTFVQWSTLMRERRPVCASARVCGSGWAECKAVGYKVRDLKRRKMPFDVQWLPPWYRLLLQYHSCSSSLVPILKVKSLQILIIIGTVSMMFDDDWNVDYFYLANLVTMPVIGVDRPISPRQTAVSRSSSSFYETIDEETTIDN